MKNIHDFFKSMDKKKMYSLILLIALGFVFVALGNTTKNKEAPGALIEQTVTQSGTNDNVNAYEKYMEDRLKAVLSGVQGVGAVDVLITYKAGFEVVLAEDEQRNVEETSESANNGGTRVSRSEVNNSKTVFARNGSNDTPLIIKEFKPEVLGVLIVAEGGDKREVQDSIKSAAMILFNVEAYKVSVLKMK